MQDAAANPRQEAMAVLSHAAPARLAEIWSQWADKPAFHKVRGPETGLVMIRGRAGGGGNPFNLGEATVTRATVRLETGEVGHSLCARSRWREGRDLRRARCAVPARSGRGRSAGAEPAAGRACRCRQAAPRRDGGHQGRFLHHGPGRGLMETIEGGFADLVLGAQSVFRAIMDSARPPGQRAVDRIGRRTAGAAHRRARRGGADARRPRHPGLARPHARRQSRLSPAGSPSTAARRSPPIRPKPSSRWSRTRPCCRRSTPSGRAPTSIPDRSTTIVLAAGSDHSRRHPQGPRHQGSAR